MDDRSRQIRREAERAGRIAEWVAAACLLMKGYRILAHRLRTPFGEIDLIAKRGTVIAIVEVKLRHSRDAALEAIVPRTQRRLARAAQAWIARNPSHAECTIRFDVMACAPRRFPRHIANAFESET